jgi:hypothetical protein
MCVRVEATYSPELPPLSEPHPDRMPKLEVAIVCRAHRRRCHVAPHGPNGTVRLWHDGVGRSGGNMCTSKTLLYRVEEELSAEEVLNRHILRKNPVEDRVVSLDDLVHPDSGA